MNRRSIRGLLITSICWSVLTAAIAFEAQDQRSLAAIDAWSAAVPSPESSLVAPTSTPTPAYERFLPPFLTQLPDAKQTLVVREAKARAGFPDPTFTPTATPTLVGRTEAPVVHSARPPASNAPPPDLTDVDFASSTEGFGVTGGGGVFLSSDGGASWHSVYQQDGAVFRTVQTLDTLTVIVAGMQHCSRSSSCENPLLLRTTDGGNHWDVVQPDLGDAQAAAGWGALEVVFTSPEVGYAVRDPNTEAGPPLKGIDARLFATRDGGRRWQALTLPVSVSPTGGLSGLDDGHLYITSGSDVLASADGGMSWRSLHADSPLPLFAVQFLDPQHGLAVGGESWFTRCPRRPTGRAGYGRRRQALDGALSARGPDQYLPLAPHPRSVQQS
jgi:hypothetical protein